MISVERIKSFSWLDILFILLASVLFTLLQFWLGKAHLQIAYAIAYYLSLAAFGFLASFITLLVQKAGTATLFGLCSGILGMFFPVMGISGKEKLLVLCIAGIIFELSFLFLRIEIYHIPFDITVGSGLAAASIPISTIFILSQNIFKQQAINVLNISLVALCIGLIVGILAFFLWYNIRSTKWVLGYEYRL